MIQHFLPPVFMAVMGFMPFWIWIFIFPIALFCVWFISPLPSSKIKSKDLHPIRASPFSPDRVPKGKIDTIVIGSGSGGCAVANLLAQSGQRVLILEQHDRTGGCTHSFTKNGCEWDTGLHYTSINMGKKTCRPGALLNFMTKGLQKWTALQDPYDEIVFPQDSFIRSGAPNESSYPFVAGSSKTVESIMSRIDPSNVELKKRTQMYMDLCLDINQGFTALGLSRVLPSFLQFLVRSKVERLMKIASMTVRDVQYAILNLGYSVDYILKHGCPLAPPGPEPDPSIRRLKAVLTHPIGDYAVQPREATMAAHGVTMAHYIDGACYSVGATQKISLRSTAVVRAMGGEVLVDATVIGILVEDGRAVGVRVANTSALQEGTCHVEVTEIRSKAVVCATSVYNLYNNLLPQDMDVVKDFHCPEKRTIRQSNGHIFLFCKIDGSADELNLPTHNLWYFNSYDMDDAFDAYFANPREVRPPTVYIGFPCTKDTTWKLRFPKISNCILISDGLWEWFEEWQGTKVENRGADYLAFKEALSKHLLDILYETVPQVQGKVSYHHLGTPLSEVNFLGSWHGGSYGTMCLPSMFDRINRNWTTTPHTKVPGLYLAGSDAFLPAVCGAMYGGCFGATAVLGHVRSLKMILQFLFHFAGYLREDDPKLPYLQSLVLAVDKFINE
ncbi:FAD dependent oxidoreductase [Nitzschia inconspicua]|uniref:FAD dependent oxidoreductase n=1 Tax=Nitzschia inconspicua TaxID=303405 RepID=A0A9K3KP87_9STRA|nr:FAD dependent oxidoreductase [Nitzschia inconspicua]